MPWHTSRTLSAGETDRPCCCSTATERTGAILSTRWARSPSTTPSTPSTPVGTGSPFTMARFAQDLLDFMDEQKLERAHLLGFSDGGNIALTFALLHPERVDRLILNGANLAPSGVKPQIQIPIVLGYAAASLFARLSPKAKHNAEILGLMVKEPRIPAEALRKLYIPTLVIVGTRDMIRDSHTLLIAGSLPNGRLEMIVGDHFIAAKNPDEFNEAVAAFLADTRSDRI